MKTKEQLLAFYGVEIGKKYRVTKTFPDFDSYYGKIIEIENCPLSMTKFMIRIDKEECTPALLNFLDYEEVKQSILNDKEREYLQHYVMDNPAFKGKVKYIAKNTVDSKKAEYIEIKMTNDNDFDFGCLSCFKPYDMYRGMEARRDYTPQELGLKE